MCLHTHREVCTTQQTTTMVLYIQRQRTQPKAGRMETFAVNRPLSLPLWQAFWDKEYVASNCKNQIHLKCSTMNMYFFIVYLCPPSTSRLVPRTTLTSAGTNKAIPYYYKVGMLERNRKGTWGIISHLGGVTLEGSEVLGNATCCQASTLHAFYPHPKV